jgi:hypothetical protein
VILLGADKKQSAILRKYCAGLLNAPLLVKEIAQQADDIIEFRNGASLEISTNDARLVRGRSAIHVLHHLRPLPTRGKGLSAAGFLLRRNRDTRPLQ